MAASDRCLPGAQSFRNGATLDRWLIAFNTKVGLRHEHEELRPADFEISSHCARASVLVCSRTKHTGIASLLCTNFQHVRARDNFGTFEGVGGREVQRTERERKQGAKERCKRGSERSGRDRGRWLGGERQAGWKWRERARRVISAGDGCSHSKRGAGSDRDDDPFDPVDPCN